MENENEKIIERRKLENGMELILSDRSRMITGDCWLVDLECVMKIPIPESYWTSLAEEEPQLLAEVRSILGDWLSFTINKKRNFVETDEREGQLQEMAQQVLNSMLEYLSRPNFPIRLFKKQYTETRDRLLVHQAMQRGADD
jgi:hypothetical protein